MGFGRAAQFIKRAHILAAHISYTGKAVEVGVGEEVARRLMERVMEESPVPPVEDPPRDDVQIIRSGAAFIGGRRVVVTGDTPPSLRGRVRPKEITIIFSTPKPVGKGGRVFYTSKGQKLFDYSPLQHRQHRSQRGWVSKKMEIPKVSGLVGGLISWELRKLKKKISGSLGGA